MALQAAQDTWGALSIPAQPDYAPFVPIAQGLWVAPAQIPLADPTLAVILDFLATAINTDQLPQAAWDQVKGPAGPSPIKRIFCHDPGEVVFNASHLPAFYMWRAGATTAYQADDWYVETTQLKALWVYPLAEQSRQQARQPFVNALVKCIAQVIERGRTPGWIQPTDESDDRTAAEGSVFYPYAGFESLFLSSWRMNKLAVPDSAGTRMDMYPAVEMTFTLEENLVYGLSRFFVSAPGAFATLYNAQGALVWAPLTAYATSTQVTSSPPNGFIYTCTTAGTSNLTPPQFWPTTIGGTVSDNGVVWTCTSTMQPNGNVTVSGPLAP
jgi:hypothetical protein